MLKLPTLFHHPKGATLHWLTSDLVLASAPADADFAGLPEAGIRTVVDLRAESADRHALAESAGLAYVRLPVPEFLAPSEAELELLTGLIVEKLQGGPVLVHCREGRGRSALVACAALVRYGYPLGEAYHIVRRARPEVALSQEQEDALTRFAVAHPPASAEGQNGVASA